MSKYEMCSGGLIDSTADVIDLRKEADVFGRKR